MVKSPINGKPMELKSQRKRFWYREKRIEIDYEFYQCESGETFLTEELSQKNLDKVYETYARKRDGNRGKH